MSLTAEGKSFQEDAKGFTQSREHSHTVIVVGAGVAGLLAALQLSMKPGLAFHATIIADEQPPDEKSRAGAPPHAFEPLDISDEVLQFLDLVKLRSSVTPSFCYPDAQAIRSWDGKLLQWIERSHPIADTQEFRRVLIKLAVERGVEFMWNTRVIDLADVGWGVVCLLSDRTQTAADLLLGCDGPRSMVRTIIEGGPDSRLNSDPSGVLAFSAEFRDSTGALNSLVDQTQHFYGPRLSAHVYSFKDGLYKFQIYVSSSIDAKTSENPADLKDGPLLPAYRNLMVLARANSPTTHLIRLLQTGTACPNLCRTVCNVRPPLRRLATGRMVVLGSASTAHDSPCFRPSNTFCTQSITFLSNILQCCLTSCGS
jgi:2-polyprenyl-6-methoxyphenol hydroxylase-like FAD-dependent oxidoreductase